MSPLHVGSFWGYKQGTSDLQHISQQQSDIAPLPLPVLDVYDFGFYSFAEMVTYVFPTYCLLFLWLAVKNYLPCLLAFYIP